MECLSIVRLINHLLLVICPTHFLKSKWSVSLDYSNQSPIASRIHFGRDITVVVIYGGRDIGKIRLRLCLKSHVTNYIDIFKRVKLMPSALTMFA